jgi:hypothetical protein
VGNISRRADSVSRDFARFRPRDFARFRAIRAAPIPSARFRAISRDSRRSDSVSRDFAP